jgi:hypothetical protein
MTQILHIPKIVFVVSRTLLRNHFIKLPDLSFEMCDRNTVQYTLLLHTRKRNVQSTQPFLGTFEEHLKKTNSGYGGTLNTFSMPV